MPITHFWSIFNLYSWYWSITFMSGAASLWLSDPAWLSMDATARGFHAQLVLMAARKKPFGTLPDDDGQWRKWLGLPAAGNLPAEPLENCAVERKKTSKKGAAHRCLPDALMQGVQRLVDNAPNEREQAIKALQGGANVWMDYLWITLWKPQIMAAWQPVDKQTIIQYPHMEGAEGLLWCEAAVVLANRESSNSKADNGKPALDAHRKKGSKKKPTPSRKRKDEIGYRMAENAPAGEPMDILMLAVNQSTEAWREIDQVLGAWRPALQSEQRRNLWDLGIACLAPSFKSPSEARAFLGRLIKVHGEEGVGQAVAELARRPIRPADSRSFLKSMLNRSQEGSAAEQRARNGRAAVAL